MENIQIQFLLLLKKLLSMEQFIQVSLLSSNSTFSLSIDDDGIARGNDALTLLENRSTYTLFIYELHRVSSSTFPVRMSILLSSTSASIIP
jgi:hypothetical protein